ncbi:uncharacterized protein LOC120306789 [Crotalus tigris]|uniref:uncharacterized protein LOC120306789 n=1 Tax=Crotalus tigris TaxID=88082 RepID=UPI00192F73C8|nr:uncharacterized protein LOC120306789 [Crotalus tigris]
MASKHLGIPVVPKGSISSLVTQTVLQTKPKSPPPSPPPPAFTLKDIQDALKKTAQEIKEEVAELLENKNREMREDIGLAFQWLAAHIERIDDRMDEVVENTARLENRLRKVEDKIDTTQDEVTISQYRDMEFALRIRGLKENPREDLREEVARDIAPILGCELEEILREIDKIFRVNSWIARQRNLPRDVVIYFSSSLRNEIIQAFISRDFKLQPKML